MAFIEINGINVHYEMWNEASSDTIVLLHGFTGSTKTWHEVITNMALPHRIIAVDLIGHGQTDSPTDENFYTMQAQLNVLKALFQQLNIKNMHLIGYSMGGRVALSYAVQYPEQIKSVILESATPGIEEANLRDERVQHDERLATIIEQEGVESFIEFWENIPLFASQKRMPEERQKALRNERTAQNGVGLANSLRMMGTGKMPSLWGSIPQFNFPITLITGELDQKFVNIAIDMKKLLPSIQHIIVPDAGHAIHVENPRKFATIVKETIITI